MADKLKNLLNICYEIEGLITLVVERNPNVPNGVHTLLQEKVEMLCQEIHEINPQQGMTESAKSIDDSAIASEKDENYQEDTDVINSSSSDINYDNDGANDYNGTEEHLNVEQMIACQGSRDLRKAFTINDKFRFRRELFGNSDTEITDAINLVSAMSTMTEAEEYFYNDLEWDRENEEVQEFMSIIANHFKSQDSQQL
ncbi:MAG: hypothetical protein IJY31_00525 [Muribaculaceae bacterium]|nr:hypothetical protein [Muribaculaceae bacterium]